MRFIERKGYEVTGGFTRSFRLTHFMPLVSFYTPRDQCHEMVLMTLSEKFNFF